MVKAANDSAGLLHQQRISIELYDMNKDIGEKNNIAAAHPKIIERISEIMKEAREGSEFTKYWPFPEHRRDDIKLDNRIYKTLGMGEGY